LIYLVEHFYSIQGEGRYVGTPSLFFRFGGCNMRCEGFGCIEKAQDGYEVKGCDTVYAVNKEHFAHNWVAITEVEALLRVLDMYELPYGVDVVLTGGEPLIYANDPLFVAFLEALVQKGHRVTFETNGSLQVDFEKYPIYRSCVFALSVKLQNSGEPFTKRVRGDVIFNIATHAKDAFFKFSVDRDSITIALEDEIENIIQHAPNTQVYCMPVGGCKKEVEANTPPLIEFCKMKGYNFSDRLHIRIWDENKGV
jgi:organic radical activating enzyme